MNNYKIPVVIGSLRKEWFNRKLAYALAKMAPIEVLLSKFGVCVSPAL